MDGCHLKKPVMMHCWVLIFHHTIIIMEVVKPRLLEVVKCQEQHLWIHTHKVVLTYRVI